METITKSEIPWKNYIELYPKAEAIFNSVYPVPRTSQEITDKINKVGSIIRILFFP